MTGSIIKPINPVLNLEHPLARHVTFAVGRHGREIGPQGLTETTTGTPSDVRMDMSFDGVNDYYTYGTTVVLDTTLPWTVAARVRLNSYPASFPLFCSLKTDIGGANFLFFVSNNATYRPFSMGSSNASFRRIRINESVNWPTGTYQDLVIHFDGGLTNNLASYYIVWNGINRATALSGSFGADTGNQAIGAQGSGASDWDGEVDYVVAVKGVPHKPSTIRMLRPPGIYDLLTPEWAQRDDFVPAPSAPPSGGAAPALYHARFHNRAA